MGLIEYDQNLTFVDRCSLLSEAEKGKGPHIIGSRGIKTCLGTMTVDVNQEALRTYLIRQSGLEPDGGQKIDELIISFGQYSSTEILAVSYALALMKKGTTMEKAIKKGGYRASSTNLASNLLNLTGLGGLKRSYLMASENYPVLYLNLPQIAKVTSADKLYEDFDKSLDHELQHAIEYLNPQKQARLMKDQKTLYIASLTATVVPFIGVETFMVYSYMNAVPDMEPYKIPALIGGSLASLLVGVFSGRIVSDGFYSFLHRGEKIAREAEENQKHQAVRGIIKLSLNDNQTTA